MKSKPVLSEQTTLTDPKASTDGSFLTIALRCDIRKTPNASVTVVTIGRPSGMAATAKETNKASSSTDAAEWIVETNLQW